MKPILKTVVSLASGVAIAATMSSTAIAFDFTRDPENKNEFFVENQYIGEFMSMLGEWGEEEKVIFTGDVTFTFNPPDSVLVELPENTQWFLDLSNESTGITELDDIIRESTDLPPANTAETVSEPGTIAGLLTVTALGLVSRRKSNSKLNEKEE